MANDAFIVKDKASVKRNIFKGIKQSSKNQQGVFKFQDIAPKLQALFQQYRGKVSLIRDAKEIEGVNTFIKEFNSMVDHVAQKQAQHDVKKEMGWIKRLRNKDDYLNKVNEKSQSYINQYRLSLIGSQTSGNINKTKTSDVSGTTRVKVPMPKSKVVNLCLSPKDFAKVIQEGNNEIVNEQFNKDTIKECLQVLENVSQNSSSSFYDVLTCLSWII